jgi:hypothetical protein
VHFRLWSSYLCLLSSWNHRCAPLCSACWLRWGLASFWPGLTSKHASLAARIKEYTTTPDPWKNSSSLPQREGCFSLPSPIHLWFLLGLFSLGPLPLHLTALSKVDFLTAKSLTLFMVLSFLLPSVALSPSPTECFLKSSPPLNYTSLTSNLQLFSHLYLLVIKNDYNSISIIWLPFPTRWHQFQPV